MTKTVMDWRDRERERQKTRTMPIWQNEPFWQTYAERHAEHFVHLSETQPPMLAYTVDADKGERDRQTIIRAGRYLTRYFSDVLTAKQIAYYAAWQTNGAKPKGESGDAEIQFATTAEEIFDVYKRGPRSCMDACHFDDPETSPVKVYAAGDLAIAYLEGEAPPNRPGYTVLARCLVWPEKKVAGRVYPTEGCWRDDGYFTDGAHMAPHYALQQKLKDAGYRFLSEGEGSFDGARLLKIEADEGDETYLMPYLDGDYGVDDVGGVWRMRHYGQGHECQETQGWIRTEPEYDWHCERCGEGQSEDSYSTTVFISTQRRSWGFRDERPWCECCTENDAFHCEGFDVYFASHNVDQVDVDGQTYSQKYAEENFYNSDYSGDWFDPENDPRVEMHDGESWSASEFEEHGFTCQITDENYPKCDMHAEHENIVDSCTDEEIAAWLAEQEKESVA